MSNEPIANPHEMRYLCDVIINEGVAYLPQWIYADQITELQQQLATLQAERDRATVFAAELIDGLKEQNERLRAALVKEIAFYRPSSLDWQCLRCNQTSGSAPEAIRHAEGCVLRTTPQEGEPHL